MRTYQVPVYVELNAESPAAARELVETALNGIDGWNELMGVEEPCLVGVLLGNESEVDDIGVAAEL